MQRQTGLPGTYCQVGRLVRRPGGPPRQMVHEVGQTTYPVNREKVWIGREKEARTTVHTKKKNMEGGSRTGRGRGRALI